MKKILNKACTLSPVAAYIYTALGFPGNSCSWQYCKFSREYKKCKRLPNSFKVSGKQSQFEIYIFCFAVIHNQNFCEENKFLRNITIIYNNTQNVKYTNYSIAVDVTKNTSLSETKIK